MTYVVEIQNQFYTSELAVDPHQARMTCIVLAVKATRQRDENCDIVIWNVGGGGRREFLESYAIDELIRAVDEEDGGKTRRPFTCW